MQRIHAIYSSIYSLSAQGWYPAAVIARQTQAEKPVLSQTLSLHLQAQLACPDSIQFTDAAADSCPSICTGASCCDQSQLGAAASADCLVFGCQGPRSLHSKSLWCVCLSAFAATRLHLLDHSCQLSHFTAPIFLLSLAVSPSKAARCSSCVRNILRPCITVHHKKAKCSIATCGSPHFQCMGNPAKSTFLGRQQKRSVCTLSVGTILHLQADIQKQADLIGNLQSAALANGRAHNDLVQHFQQLRTQVGLNTKSQQLLQDLSGAYRRLLP